MDNNDDLFGEAGSDMLPANLTAGIANIYRHTKKVMWTLVQYKDMQMKYSCAIKEIKTKFDVLSTEFNVKHKRNPISSISSRLKSTESIVNKLMRKDLPFSIEGMENNLFDIAGVRVVCSYIDDIYAIADALLAQDDIELVERKDYIKQPKPNGYRSLHLIVRVPVFFAGSKENVPVEVQIRTIAMDFWASLEHQLRYKSDVKVPPQISDDLKACADVIAATDEEMQRIAKELHVL